jgi:hypothetical protein
MAMLNNQRVYNIHIFSSFVWYLVFTIYNILIEIYAFSTWEPSFSAADVVGVECWSRLWK